MQNLSTHFASEYSLFPLPYQSVVQPSLFLSASAHPLIRHVDLLLSSSDRSPARVLVTPSSSTLAFLTRPSRAPWSSSHRLLGSKGDSCASGFCLSPSGPQDGALEGPGLALVLAWRGRPQISRGDLEGLHQNRESRSAWFLDCSTS